MLDIAIFGQHPDIKYGFNAAMTMNWVLALSKNKNISNVTLYINNDFYTEKNLTLWGCEFEIKFLPEGQPFSSSHDVIIWQSYHDYDRKKYWSEYIKGAYLKVKNFPRFFTGDINKDKTRLSRAEKNFDLIMFSLMEDQQISETLGSTKTAYVPRGFSARHIIKAFDNDSFTVSIDVRKPNNIINDDYEVFLQAREILERRGISVKLQALGRLLPNVERVKRCSTIDFYKTFINTADVYAFVDRTPKFLDSHKKSGGLTNYCGIYENSVVEAQIAGLMVISPNDIVPNELIVDGYNGVRLRKDDDPLIMADAIEYCYHNYKQLERRIRAEKIKSNSLNTMSKNFVRAIIAHI
ncbi:glycosyltransferase [Vibrio astriarenae]